MAEEQPPISLPPQVVAGILPDDPTMGQLTRTAAADLAGTAAYLMKRAQLLTVAIPEEIHYEREELGRAFRALDDLMNKHYTAALLRAGRLPS